MSPRVTKKVGGASSSLIREQDAPVTIKPALVPKLRFPEFRNAEGWEATPGDELFDQVNNRQAPAGLPILAITQEHGAIPRDIIDYHVSVTDKSVETYKEVRPGDFIISLRSFQGGIEYSEYNGICSPAYVILRKRAELSDLFFKQHFKSHCFIQQLTKNLEGLRDGKMVSYKQFSELLLLNPTLPEQQKIADCLTSLDDLIAAQARKVDALKTHKKGLMQQLFPRDGETQPRIRFPGFQNAGEWCTKSLIKYFPKIRNGFVGTVSPFYVPNGIPYLQGKNIKQGKIDDTGLIRINHSFHEKQKKSQLKKGDILMVQSGHVGECAVVGEDFDGGNCHALIVLSPAKETFSPFFKHFFYAPLGLELIAIVKTGNTIAHILSTDLRVMMVLVPEADEQRRIADCLSSLDDLIAAQTQKLEALKTHKKGLMQQLFPNPEEVVF